METLSYGILSTQLATEDIRDDLLDRRRFSMLLQKLFDQVADQQLPRAIPVALVFQTPLGQAIRATRGIYEQSTIARKATVNRVLADGALTPSAGAQLRSDLREV